MAQKKGTYPNGNRSGPLKPTPLSKQTLLVDYERYAHMLDDSDLSEEAKQEFLQTLWSIICDFVAMGWGVHPVQQVEKTCGQLAQSHAEGTVQGKDVLELKDTISIQKSFNKPRDEEESHDHI